MLLVGIGFGGWALFCLPVTVMPGQIITILPRAQIGLNDVEYEVPVNTRWLWLYPKLDWLQCGQEQLTELDVSANTALQVLWCYSNELTELDVSANTSLRNLWCAGNQLTELDLSLNTELTQIDCSENSITGVLDMSANTNITKVVAIQNAITELVVWDTNSLPKQVPFEDDDRHRAPDGIYVDPGVVIREP